MQIKLWRLMSIITLLAIFPSTVYGSSISLASTPEPQAAAPNPNIQVILPSYVGVSQPLRSLARIAVETNPPEISSVLPDRLSLPKAQNASDGSFDASVVQESQGITSMPTPDVNFEGVNNVNGVYPPDTQGDVGYDPATGKKYYVQWVNLSYRIWDVTDPLNIQSVLGPVAGNTLWSGTGTDCATSNDGDVITLYDHLANRWFMSQFLVFAPPYYQQCIAVSQTADPTGEWYLYDFRISKTNMNDYPKFGVWPDGYYMSVNQFAHGNTWAGAGVAVFERLAMLAGSTSARMIYFDTGPATNDIYGGMLPSDLDGPSPAEGTPNYFVEWDDSTWLGDPADTIRIWEFHTNWDNPTNSTFGVNSSFDPNFEITTADVNPTLCSGTTLCIPQPDTSQKLDALNDRLMYRLQYRNFGTYQTLVTNHTVNADGLGNGGIHWFELRDTGSGFAMYQQGVYAPDADSRWMGSIAMDVSGDMALGFSVSNGTTTYPSIRYTGRLVNDTLGTLPQGEVPVMAGGGSQTGNKGRWGDYSMMAVAESDGCTFWYTQEYIQSTGGAPWRTRVASFKFPTCSMPTAVTLEGTVEDSSANPIESARVEASGGYTTFTDEAGHYALSLPKGSFDLTASKYGYIPVTITGVVVEPPGTTQDFTLSTASISTISGIVTDSTTEWPLYARIDISGYPGSPIFTDPVTGAYNLQLANGDYTFTASAMSGGYTPGILPVVVTGNATHDFALMVDSIACSAPGYSLSSTPATEILDSSVLAACAPIASGGLVVGAVFDANSGTAIANPSITDAEQKLALIMDNSADPHQAHPLYVIGEPAGAVSLTASAPDYSSATETVGVVANAAVRQDFSLEAGTLSANPGSLEFTVGNPLLTASKPVTLFNSGGAAVNYEVFAVPGVVPGYEPVGPFAAHTRHFGPKNLSDLDASQIRVDLTPLDVPMLGAGDVSASWPTGLMHAWGIGFNTDAADLWLGDVLSAGGDGLNHRLTMNGDRTGDTIDTTQTVDGWNADMTYNPFTHRLWQVSVGGDGCIYELDPVRRASTGNKICPPFGTSERGLAFDPLTKTYYAASWNDGIINHFAPDGTLIDSKDVSLNISGLAFNPSSGHLFALTNNAHLANMYDVYILDSRDSYRILGGFNLMENGVEAFTPNGQAGLEIDCAGNLWAVDQNAQKVYVAASGETGFCSYQASWLTTIPASGSVPSGGSTVVNVNVDANGLPLGTYPAYLRVTTNAPYGDVIVPVSLKVVEYQFLPVVRR